VEAPHRNRGTGRLHRGSCSCTRIAQPRRTSRTESSRRGNRHRIPCSANTKLPGRSPRARGSATGSIRGYNCRPRRRSARSRTFHRCRVGSRPEAEGRRMDWEAAGSSCCIDSGPSHRSGKPPSIRRDTAGPCRNPSQAGRMRPTRRPAEEEVDTWRRIAGVPWGRTCTRSSSRLDWEKRFRIPIQVSTRLPACNRWAEAGAKADRSQSRTGHFEWRSARRRLRRYRRTRIGPGGGSCMDFRTMPRCRRTLSR
jgi:hypothetical protein